MWKKCFVLALIAFDSGFGSELVSGINLLTSDVYKEILRKSDGNFIVSPFSAQVILALTEFGAKGPTAQELLTGLRLPDEGKIQEYFKSLLPRLLSKDESFSLKSANKIYVKNDFTIKDDFKKIATEVFHSQVENIDFSQQDQAAKMVNQWVEEQTEDKIHDLITSSDLDPTTKLLLVNALYFKAKWAVPFFEFGTTKVSFYKTAKETVPVLMMRETLTSFQFAQNSELNAQFLELPFENANASMTFVLPNDQEGLPDLEKKIDKVLSPQEYSLELVDVEIPKFKAESTLDLKDILINLGIKKAFVEGEADFGRISDVNLVISDARQKAFIDVNEEGVEAAAATTIRLVDYSGVEKPVKIFHADHPFIYYIKVNDVIIFVGRVTLPVY